MANSVKNINFKVPDYLAADFEAVYKMYGLTPSDVLRYFVWNARNLFDRYSNGDIEKVQNLVLMANAELTVAAARLMEGKDLHKKVEELETQLAIIGE